MRTAEPVGSRALAKRYFPTLSPATLRNVMADLEEMGYLAQPHTSAGRVPTDKAYRLYVEAVPPPVPTPVPAEGRPSRATGVEGFMERTSSQLSSATKLTALLLDPAPQADRRWRAWRSCPSRRIGPWPSWSRSRAG